MRELFLQRAKLLVEFEELRLLLRQDVRGVHVDALGLKGAVIARRVIGVLFAVGEDAREDGTAESRTASRVVPSGWSAR